MKLSTKKVTVLKQICNLENGDHFYLNMVAFLLKSCVSFRLINFWLLQNSHLCILKPNYFLLLFNRDIIKPNWLILRINDRVINIIKKNIPKANKRINGERLAQIWLWCTQNIEAKRMPPSVQYLNPSQIPERVKISLCFRDSVIE